MSESRQTLNITLPNVGIVIKFMRGLKMYSGSVLSTAAIILKRGTPE